MFKNTYQGGLLSIFFSVGSNPLSIWDSSVQNGHIKRVTDKEVNSLVLEIISTNVATTYIACPKGKHVLGIKLPFIVMIIKNVKRYFSFEITILDDKNMRRRFRTSNFQSTTKIKPFCTSMPIGLAGGWNQVQFNLSDFTRRAYGTQYMETLRVQIHANVRVRRIYFCDRLYQPDQLPKDYKLFLPLQNKDKKGSNNESVKVDASLVQGTRFSEPESVSKTEKIAKQEKGPSLHKIGSNISEASTAAEAKSPSRKSSVQIQSLVTEERNEKIMDEAVEIENTVPDEEVSAIIEIENISIVKEAQEQTVEETATVQELPAEEQPLAEEFDAVPSKEQNFEQVNETA